ncbi:hypothetical protein R3P38DRAFT_2781404 [Favolaschia claudopus]|uniref:Uncharacterized protein n=1 Tax=Favolaschia claudopus TaxID=2862362 RepID=A0AAW0B6M5_9AGAR
MDKQRDIYGEWVYNTLVEIKGLGFMRYLGKTRSGASYTALPPDPPLSWMLTSKRSSSAARKCGKPKPLTTIVLVPPILTSQRRSSFPPLTAAAKVQLYAAVEGCLAGRLREESYNDVVAEATNLFYKDSEQATGDSRRGDFIAVSAGVSFGGGQKRPGALLNNKRNCTICSQMVLSWAIMGIVGFATGLLTETIQILFGDTSHQALLSLLLESPPFLPALSILARTPLQFHMSMLPTSFGGWCCINALGHFNPDLGGHLVLWDLKLII